MAGDGLLLADRLDRRLAEAQSSQRMPSVSAGPMGRNVSWFEPEGEDRWRCVEGREQGELLRAVRDRAGAVVKPYFAAYPLTRAPSVFGDS